MTNLPADIDGNSENSPAAEPSWSVGVICAESGKIDACVAGLSRTGIKEIRLFVGPETIVPPAASHLPLTLLNDKLPPRAVERFAAADLYLRTPTANAFLFVTTAADLLGIERWILAAKIHIAGSEQKLLVDSRDAPGLCLLTRDSLKAYLSNRDGLSSVSIERESPHRFGEEIIDWANRVGLCVETVPLVDTFSTAEPTSSDDFTIRVSGASVSIVVPNWNCAGYLGACLDSLLRQTAAAEVIVVDDASTDDSARVLESFGERITVVKHAQRRGANAARNTGIAAASGDFIAFADADNVYAPRWAEQLRDAILSSSSAALAYCGYTKQLPDGSRIENRGAPWDLDTLWFGNYIDMSSLVRRSAIPATGLQEGFRPFDDWRLWLHLAQRGWQGAWVPGSLFVKHVRSAGKTRQSMDDLDQRGREIVELRREFAGLVGLEKPVSVVVPACGCDDLTARCFAHLGDYCGVPFHVVYVDNGSPVATLDCVARAAGEAGISLRIIRNLENRGFTQAINQGIEASGDANVLVLNNDCFIGPGCVENLARELRHDDRVAAAGPLTGDDGKQSLRNEDRRALLQLPEEILDELDDPVRVSFRLSQKLRSVSEPVLSFYCALLSHDALRRHGGLDARFSSGLAADDEWCFRVRRHGREVRLVLNAYAAHLHQSSFKRLEIDRHSLQRDAQNLLHRVLASGRDHKA